MSNGQLDDLARELGSAGDDVTARRDLLERAAMAMLRRPEMAAQLVDELCATAEDDAELESLAEILTSALDAARMARESRQKRGNALIAAVEKATEQAVRDGRASAVHRLLMARIWTRGGLATPAALQLDDGGMEADQPSDPPMDLSAIDSMIDEMLGGLVIESEEDAIGVHAALAEMLPAMPAELRAHVVAKMTGRADTAAGQLACYWLLDPSPANRRAAAEGLSRRLAQGGLPADLAARLVLLRNWMPDDGARARLDQTLRDAMRRGLGVAAPAAAWTMTSVLGSLPDGAGARSIAVALQSGKRRAAAMVLLKEGQGIKDAYVIPCKSAAEQKRLMTHVSDETGAFAMPATLLSGELAMALGDGLAGGLPPAPGLIDVVGRCGLTDLRPRTVATADRIAEPEAHRRVAVLSERQRSQLIDSSRRWPTRHEMVRSWFEQSDSTDEALDQPRGAKAMEDALWALLETRREWWARLVAHAAVQLDAAGHPDADGFAATAAALAGKSPLRKIPIMAYVHERTIEAWMLDRQTFEARDEAEDDQRDLTEPPKPERKGELARHLKGAEVSEHWIDGFLMALVVAPKWVTPDKWLNTILNITVRALAPDQIQRFVDLLIMRANGAADLVADKGRFEVRMAAQSAKATKDWAAGFTGSCEAFRKSWPARSTAADDRAMLGLIAQAAERGFEAGALRTLSQWLELRFARSQQ